MEEIMEMGIKDIIDEYPKVEAILDEYSIKCGACSVGFCHMKDIVEIHTLPSDDEKEMMDRINHVIESGDTSAPENFIESKPVEAKRPDYRPAMKKLVNEHTLIKRLLAVIPSVAENINLETEEGRQMILDAVDFIRNYADKYHHAKEEDILFEYFDKDLNILKVMYDDHVTGRGHVKAVLEGVDERDQEKAVSHLLAYRDLLTDHIRKEDEVLLPWLQGELSIAQLEELFGRFNQVDDEMGAAVLKYPGFIKSLEEKFGA